MKTSLRNVRLLLMGCSLMLATAACNSTNSNGDSTADSTTRLEAAIDTMTSKVDNALTPNPEQDFVSDVVKANRHEIMMLQDGIDHGTSKTLKANATKMLADHKKMGDEVMAYASKKNLALPEEDHDMDHIDAKAGKDWDKEWADDMVDGHEKTISRFEKGQNDVTDPELKDMITKTLPTLHNHLDMTKQLQNSLK